MKKRFSSTLYLAATAAAVWSLAPDMRAQTSANLTSPSSDTFLAAPASVGLSANATNTALDPIYTVAFLTNNAPLVVFTNAPAQYGMSASCSWTNIVPGTYNVAACATTVGGQTNVTDPVLVYVYTNGGGTISISTGNLGSVVDLSSNGTNDWAHWGYYWASTFNHKRGVASQIGNFSVLNYGTIYSDVILGGKSFTWTDGTPIDSTAGINQGAFTYDGGFDFPVGASTNATLRTVKVYAGAFAGATGRLTAFLTDGSTAPIEATIHNFSGTTNATFTVSFRAVATNQFLRVRYVNAFIDIGYTMYVGLYGAVLSTGDRPPQATITSPLTQAVFGYPTNLVIDASASDPDGSVSKVEFFDAATKIGEITASPYHFVWTNAPAGPHKLTARATDNQGTTFTSPEVDVSVTTGTGFLSGRFDALPGTAYLTAEGRTDWAHWGLGTNTGFNYRAVVAQRISNVTSVAGGALNRLNNFPTTFNWTNGTPILSTNSTEGIFVYGSDNGFQITAPADTLRRRLKVYVSAYAALGALEASLSDGSAVAFTDYAISNIFDSSYGVYTLDYAAGSSNATLTVKFTASVAYDSQYGNVTLEAATLSMLDADLRNVTRSGNTVRLDFPSDDLQSYQLEYTDTLVPTNWVPLTSFLGNGALTNISDTTATGAQRFYRVTGP